METSRRIAALMPPSDGGHEDLATLGLRLRTAGAELVRLESDVASCKLCVNAAAKGAAGATTHSTGNPLARCLLVKAKPSPKDDGIAFRQEGAALRAAFAKLDCPISWFAGTCAVRHSHALANALAGLDAVKACAGHLHTMIEIVLPELIVAFGDDAFAALKTLDGKAGIEVPKELARGTAANLRQNVLLIVSDSLPEGIEDDNRKAELWKDLKFVASLLR